MLGKPLGYSWTWLDLLKPVLGYGRWPGAARVGEDGRFPVSNSEVTNCGGGGRHDVDRGCEMRWYLGIWMWVSRLWGKVSMIGTHLFCPRLYHLQPDYVRDRGPAAKQVLFPMLLQQSLLWSCVSMLWKLSTSVYDVADYCLENLSCFLVVVKLRTPSVPKNMSMICLNLDVAIY
jgi:hypothetical protein